MASLVETRGLTAFYGDFQAVFGVDIRLEVGETIAVIGANGAGKSALMRSLAGVIASSAEMVLHRGEPIGALGTPDVVRRGIALVPEGRRLFPSLTVEENLLIGSYGRQVAAGLWTLESIYALFPILKERRRNPATALSGGQQQMVAIGRALMVKSTAVADAGVTKQTLYEVERSQFTRGTYDRALESLNLVNGEIEAHIRSTWGRK